MIRVQSRYRCCTLGQGIKDDCSCSVDQVDNTKFGQYDINKLNEEANEKCMTIGTCTKDYLGNRGLNGEESSPALIRAKTFLSP